MQFRPAMATAILEGRKTVTRRPVEIYNDQRWGPDGDYDRVKRNGRLIYVLHGTYAVQPGRGQRSVARIQIDNIALGYLRDMNLSDARLEGFADLDGFRRLWRSMYGPFDPDLLVYVIVFHLLPGQPAAGPKEAT